MTESDPMSPSDPDAPVPQSSEREPEDRESEERARLIAAAVAAEMATGEHEASRRTALRHVFVRLARMGTGSVLVLAGLAMLVLPGPGFLVIALGLALLARDVPWAARTLERVKQRIPGAEPDGSLPTRVIVIMVAVTVAFAATSVWWQFIR